MNHHLSFEDVSSLLTYDPATGVFTWKKKPCGVVKAGDIAGNINNRGYCKIKIKGKQHQASHLAWLLVHGVWPDDQIDHINGTPCDNRIANLRPASCSENQQNRKKPSTNTSGLIGAFVYRDKFTSQIRRDNKIYYLGVYGTAEEAHQAYVKAKAALHSFNPTVRPE